MKKDKLLEEFKAMKVSNPQEFVGGLQEWVSYPTAYTTTEATTSSAGVQSQDTVIKTKTDYKSVPDFPSIQDNTRVNLNIQ